MISLINLLNELLWGTVLIYLLACIGIYLTVQLGFIQFSHFKHMFSILKKSRQSTLSGISPFQALSMSMAARLGVGNIAGVAFALTTGGAGAIFWMWLMAILGMATSFAESTLAQLYKTKDVNGDYRGGPAYYMEKGLGMRWMGMLFSVLLVIGFGLLFNLVQANSIAWVMQSSFGWEPFYVGISIAFFTGITIFSNFKVVVKTAEILIPLMVLGYLAIALFIVIINIEKLPDMLLLIFYNAFGFQEVVAGSSGYFIGQAMINGARLSLFSNEAGLGSAPNIAASASAYPSHPVSQGYMQMLGVFIDTVVICSATAAIILMSGEYFPHSEISGIELTQISLMSQFGDVGAIFVSIVILIFSFTSLIANYIYAETNLIFLRDNKKSGILIFRIMVLVSVMLGSVSSFPFLWYFADLLMGVMTIINIIAISLLSSTVFKLAKDYNNQLKQGKVPVFNIDNYPELQSQLEQDIWNNQKNKD